MFSIRRGVFETNSSSSHSLVILKDDAVEQENNSLYFTHDEMLDSLRSFHETTGVYDASKEDWYFGRAPFRALDTFELKFQYAYASEFDRDTLIELLKELIPEVTRFIPSTDLGTDDCMLHYWLDEHGITMKEFLTCKKYIVIQDGDEYCIWSRLIKSGLIDMNVIENSEEQPHEK